MLFSLENFPTLSTESVRLLERLGFALEGYRRDFSWEDDGLFHDSAMFAQLEQDHQQESRRK